MLVENAYYHNLWEEDRKRKIAREKHEEEMRKKLGVETVNALNEQMALIREKNVEKLRLKHEEAMLMVRLLIITISR